MDRPWENEKDHYEWKDECTGYRCEIKRNSFGSLCGYVEIPDWHCLFGKDYDYANKFVRVHGGLTYAGDDGNGHKFQFGFDCSHYGDLCPFMLKNRDSRDLANYTYRDYNYVKKETEQLAIQLFILSYVKLCAGEIKNEGQ